MVDYRAIEENLLQEKRLRKFKQEHDYQAVVMGRQDNIVWFISGKDTSVNSIVLKVPI